MVKKIHTRTKRKFGLTSSFGHKKFFSGYTAPHGAKTFKTQESAKAHAKEKGLKDTEFILVPAKKGKKIKIELV
jgi:hypothetical protein